QEENDHRQDAEVDVGLHPLLERSEAGAIRALADAEVREEIAEREADGAVRETDRRAPVLKAVPRVIEVRAGDDDEENDKDSSSYRSPREMTISSSVSRYSSGVSRMAAPVGQLRTHAGPPAMPRQRSHFTATVRSTSSTSFFLNRPLIHPTMERSGSGWTMKI